MEPVEVQKKQSGGSPDFSQALWDPFWFMRELFGWGRAVEAPSFDAKKDAKKKENAPSINVKETEGAYVCKLKLALPDQADVAHMQAKLDNGELTVVVPKAAAAAPEPASPPPKKSQAKGSGRGSASRTPRRGRGSRSRRG